MAWAGALVVTIIVLLLSIVSRLISRVTRSPMTDPAVVTNVAPTVTTRGQHQDDGAGPEFLLNGFHALKDINMEIPEKKVTAFIGPSGCGKSTLLRTFNRMYELYPGMQRNGEIMLRRREHSRPK